jgi:hypothetical protein
LFSLSDFVGNVLQIIISCLRAQSKSAVGGKLLPVDTSFFTFSGASAPMFCAKSPGFIQQVEQMVRLLL